MSLTEITLTVTFVVWGVFSVANQFTGLIRFKFKEYDILSLIPYWTFFAPNPSVSDYRFFYILYKEENIKSDFIEVNYFFEKKIWHIFWNPYKRINKFVFDTLQSLIQLFDVVEIERIQRSLPYFVLLTFLKNVNRNNSEYDKFQFLIVETYGINTEKKPKVIFTSAKHSIS